jgi:hypothetical protein
MQQIEKSVLDTISKRRFRGEFQQIMRSINHDEAVKIHFPLPLREGD